MAAAGLLGPDLVFSILQKSSIVRYYLIVITILPCDTQLERRFVHLKFCSPAIRAKVFVPMGGSEKLPARDAKLFLPFVMT